MAVEVALLVALAALTLVLKPFANPDMAAALVTTFIGVPAIAVHNPMQRGHMPNEPRTSFMTGNSTDATIYTFDLVIGPEPQQAAPMRAQITALTRNIFCFLFRVAALFYWDAGFWSLLAPALLVSTAALISVRRSVELPP